MYCLRVCVELKQRTIGTNFAVSCCLNSNTTQFGDSGNEVRVENVSIWSKGINSVPGPLVSEEDLIRGEKALSLLEVLVINVIESSGSGWVHVNGNPWIHVPRAHLLQLDCVLPVQWWVHWSLPIEVVYSIRELAAVGESKSVCTCKFAIN